MAVCCQIQAAPSASTVIFVVSRMPSRWTHRPQREPKRLLFQSPQTRHAHGARGAFDDPNLPGPPLRRDAAWKRCPDAFHVSLPKCLRSFRRWKTRCRRLRCESLRAPRASRVAKPPPLLRDVDKYGVSCCPRRINHRIPANAGRPDQTTNCCRPNTIINHAHGAWFWLAPQSGADVVDSLVLLENRNAGTDGQTRFVFPPCCTGTSACHVCQLAPHLYPTIRVQFFGRGHAGTA